MVKINGIIITENPTSSPSVWKYNILEKDNIHHMTYFGDQLMTHYKVCIEYETKENFTYKNDIYNKYITKVIYLNLITDVKYIKNILIDIGISSTNLILKKFGKNTLEYIFNDADKLQILKLSDHDYKKIKILIDKDIFRIYNNFFCENGVKFNQKWIKILQNRYGTDLNKIISNPYDLIKCEISFKLVDIIGLKYKLKTDPQRINAMANYIYKKLDKKGIIYATESEIKDMCKIEKIVEIDNIVKNLFLDILCAIVVNNELYYTTNIMLHRERYIEMVCRELKNKKVNKIKYNPYEIFDNNVQDKHQKAAIDMIMTENISIVSGAPGTGKTSVIAKSSYFFDSGTTIVLAPTGTAVEKLKLDINQIYKSKNEYLKIKLNAPECMTMHSFIYNSEQNLKYSTVYIDEMSMVPMTLFYDLLKIISGINNLKLILTGDKNQLPSIGGGNILTDLIRYLPLRELKTIHRSKTITINENALLVLNGQDISTDDDSLIFEKVDTLGVDINNEIAKKLLEVIKKYDMKHNDTSIIIPQKAKGVCTRIFNKILEEHYNKDAKILYEYENNFEDNKTKITIRLNDKLINKKNDYKKNIYNGSILTAKSYSYNKIIKKDDNLYVSTIENGVTVREILYNKKNYKSIYKEGHVFNHILACLYHQKEDDLENGIEICFSGITKTEFHSQLKNIELAYATTVHSAQGKGFNNVIIILHSTMYIKLLSRKILYTALTRTKLRCVIIVDKSTVRSPMYLCKRFDDPRVTNLFQYNYIGQRLKLIPYMDNKNMIYYSMILYINSRICDYVANKLFKNECRSLGIKLDCLDFEKHPDYIDTFFKFLLNNNNALCRIFSLMKLINWYDVENKNKKNVP